MRLKSLELQGFKTFPDKTLLSFEEGITSVVGPNGSGKSNISDAMRWVLGEQSTRILRCSKMEDVIFSGTPRRKALGYAEVTLNIENRDRGLDFDNDNVAVTRRYYRSGESEYLINKTLVRLKDVNEMFMDTGLGRDGYSIIGQGKIDSIVAAKTEERREIFEEASGISRYRYRKEESERRLQRAEENLTRLRDILTELEDRVEPLRMQAERAERFIAYDAEKKDLEIGLWVETLRQSGKILREHGEKIEIAQSQQESAVEELDAIDRKSEALYREGNALTAQAEAVRNEAVKLDEQAVRTEGEILVLENDISHNTQNSRRIEGQISAAALSEKELDWQIAAKEEEVRIKEGAVSESRARLDAYMLRLEELRRDADQATRSLEENALKSAQIHVEISEKRIALSSANSSETEIRLRAGAVDERVSRNEANLVALEKEGAALSQMLADLDKAISGGQNAVKGYEMRLQTRRQKADAAKEHADQLMLDTGEQERRAKLLTDLERNLEGFAHSVKAVVKESQRGVLQGIYGPVTKILHTPREYAVALETALGGAMQHIVVETQQDAKAAIQFLKKNNTGRATFLPRTIISGNAVQAREMEGLPGFIGIASALCSCEDKFSGIRDSLLGRVAVAEDLDSAVGIAKQTGYRYRIVSLDGQVVNAGGSLTGGAQARNSGLLSRSAEIERITEKAQQLRRQAQQAQQEWKARQEEASACLAELEAMKGELSALQEERVQVTSQSVSVQRDLQTSQAEGNALLLEKKNAGARLTQLKAAQEEAQTAIAGLEKTAAALREEHETLTGSREDQMARVDDISNTIQEIRLGELAAKKDVETLRHAVAELHNRKLTSGDTVKQLKEEVAVLETAAAALQTNIAACRAAAGEYRARAAEKRNAAQGLSKEREALERQTAQLRIREREITARRETVAQELARLQERADNFQKEYDNIISRLWEEYELTRKEAEEISTEIADVSRARLRLAELKNEIKALGSVNVGAVVEYQEVSQRYRFMKEQTEDVERSKSELTRLISDLTRQMREQFIERFQEINRNFGLIFKELFGGGAAELRLTDETDILTCGIEILVNPPGKIVTHIESLSGGEKALVAISIYFSIMRVNPPPFCVLDEIEAALDDVNVARFAQYLGRMSRNTQFITITHRRGTMEGSDMLYGVTMQDQGISKLLALKTQAEAERLHAVT